MRWSFSHRAGYRGVFLLILAAGFAAYGIGMEVGYEPTVAKVFGWPTHIIGLAFIVSGMAVATGILSRVDRFHYAFAAMAAACWAVTLSLVWAAPVGWAAAVSWMIVAASSLVASAWPDPPQVDYRPLPPAQPAAQPAEESTTRAGGGEE